MTEQTQDSAASWLAFLVGVVVVVVLAAAVFGYTAKPFDTQQTAQLSLNTPKLAPPDLNPPTIVPPSAEPAPAANPVPSNTP